MSTFAFALITNARDNTTPGEMVSKDNTRLQTYVDTFAALVPAEVLTLPGILISFTTETIILKSDGGDKE